MKWVFASGKLDTFVTVLSSQSHIVRSGASTTTAV